MDSVDSIDWDKILKKYMERQDDTKSPISAGLMTAGLSMLAGNQSGGNIWQSLGQGGLLGLQAVQAEKDRQLKDPTQLIALATAVEKLREMKEGRDFMKSFTPATGNEPLQFQPAPNLPANIQQRERGMFDRGMTGFDPDTGKLTGESAYLGSMQPPPSVGGYLAPGNTPEMIRRLTGGLGMEGRAGKFSEKMLELYSKSPVGMAKGTTPTTFDPARGWVQGQQIADLDKNMTLDAEGNAIPYPGALKSVEDLAGAAERGKQSGGLPYQSEELPLTAGGSVNVSKDVGLLARQYNIDAGVAREIINSGLPRDRWPVVIAALKQTQAGGPGAGMQVAPGGDLTGQNPGVGTVLRPPAGAPPPVQPGLRPELYGTMSLPEQEGRKALRVQELTQPGTEAAATVRDLGKAGVDSFVAGHKAAQTAAYEILPSIADIKQRIAKGAFTGGGAETKSELLNMLSGWTGISIASEAVAQTMALRSSLGVQLLGDLKKLGANPTREDAARLDNIIGKEGMSAKALTEIMNTRERLANQIIERHNQDLGNMERVLKARQQPTDFLDIYRIAKPDAASAATSAQPPGPPPTMGARWSPIHNKWFVPNGKKWLEVQP
jgi:hypothetical protein